MKFVIVFACLVAASCAQPLEAVISANPEVGVHGTGLLGNLPIVGGVVDGLLGENGLVGGLLGPNGLVGGLLGPRGLLGGLLGGGRVQTVVEPAVVADFRDDSDGRFADADLDFGANID